MRQNRLYVGALLLVVLPCLAATPAATSVKPSQATKSIVSFFRGAPLPKWAEPTAVVPPTTRRDPVVVRLMETQEWVGANPAVLINRAVQVNDKSLLGEIGQYGVSYYPAYQKLYLHRVAILRGEQVMDRTAVVNTRLLEREPSLESGFYIGETTVQLLLDDVRVGDTLLVTYTTEGRNPVFGSTWADEFSWDYIRPVELRKLTISHPANRPLHWRELGDAHQHTITPVVERSGALERLRFEGRALEAFEGELGIPSGYLPFRRIQTSEYASWQEVAAWAARLFARPPDSPAVMALARQFESAKTEEARASAALHWVQDEIRYFSVALGENSHRPQAPDAVLKRRFGDCKDKSSLLIAILGRLGIKAEAVLVSSRAPAYPQKILPSPSLFDHVIVRVHADGNTYFVDPTRESEKGLLSQLPVAIPGAAGLVVADASTALLTLPEDATDLPLVDSSEKFIIASLDGDAQLEVQNRFRGKLARFIRQRYAAMGPSDLRNAVLGDYDKQFLGATIVGEPHTEDSDDGATFSVTARLSLPKPVTLADQMYSIPHRTRIMEGSLGIPDKLARKFPFELPLGLFRSRYRMQIVWPENVKMVNADDAKVIDNPFFSARKEYSWRGNEVDFMIDYAIKRKQLEPAELPELETQSKLLMPFVESSLRFHDSSTVQPKALHFSVRDGSVAHALMEITEIAGMVKDDAKAKGVVATNDLLCTGILDATFVRDIYPSIRQPAAALFREFDARKSPDALKSQESCIGRVYFREGDYKQAVTHLANAGVPQDDHALTLELGWARLASGDASGATKDAQRFVTARLKQGTLIADDAALAMLLFQRSGQTAPAELAAYANAAPDGPWPRPILAYLSGQLNRDQLLKTAGQFGAIKREMALNDAWFYIGARLQQEGKLDEARNAYRWFAANGIHGTRTAALALNELKQMEADPDVLKGLAASNQKPSDFKSAREYYLKAAARGVGRAETELGFLAENGKLGKPDFHEAFAWYERAAHHGELSGMNYLAIFYDEGRGVAKDPAKAIEWFTRAAASGHYYASRNLGWRYRFGTSGVPSDAKEALVHFQTAAQLGNPDAQRLLSEMYFEGVGTDKDLALALYWASRSAELNDAKGIAQFAFMLAYGHGVAQDLPKAIALWRQAAEMGAASAQVQLGNAYHLGRGVEADPKLAFEWFSKAAANGNTYAERRVGIAYLFGEGVSANPKNARASFERIITKNDNEGYYWLGHMTKTGRDGPVDLQQTEKLFRQGAELGNPTCQSELAMSLQFGRAGKTDLAEAASWYRKASDQGNLTGTNNLADMYEKGMGVAQDLPQAILLYRKAAQGGNATSLFSLGELNELGKGMAANNYLAFVYYQLASNAGFKNAGAALDRISKALSEDQVKRARSVAAAWHSPEPLPGASGATAETAN